VGGGERPGQVIGLDVSDEMIRRARASSTAFDNIMFIVGSAEQIPWEENFFDKILSVESFYYYGDQERALAELFRVMAPQGELYILINLYRDNHYSLRWVEELKVPVQVRSEQEYVDLLKEHAFEGVRAVRIPDLTPTPEEYSGRWFKNSEELRDFKRIGALLLVARKPDVPSPPKGYEIY
jgi:ubiquinone/menaquinone biosynthesis C-methylase UbiE